MWQEFGADGTLGRLIGYLPEQPVLKGLLGICFSSELNAKQFPYGIGVEYDGREVDKDFEILTIPASTYAVFMSRGKMPDAFVETYHRIVTVHHLPQGPGRAGQRRIRSHYGTK